jgi:hypothetical protein
VEIEKENKNNFTAVHNMISPKTAPLYYPENLVSLMRLE